MKYGQQLHEQSIPQWAPYNIDYDELKNLIKKQTTSSTSSAAQAVAIPGQHNGSSTVSQDFEESFFHEMTSQHDRVDLFVRSKADEIHRRLEYLEKVIFKLIARPRPDGKPASEKRRQRFAKYDSLTSRCLADTRDLQHFVDAQRVAFHKILKKYKKWTGHRLLAERFHDEILGNIKSFLKRDFRPLLSQSSDLLAQVKAATPIADEAEEARIGARHHNKHAGGSDRPKLTTRATSYWNEYDDAEEDARDGYAIYINQPGDNRDGGSSLPGAETVSYIISYVRTPFFRARNWLLPHRYSDHDDEHTSLLGSKQHRTSSSYSATSDTDVEDTAGSASPTSSTEYPDLFQHYPSYHSHSLPHGHNHALYARLLIYGMLASFLASFILLATATLLVSTGRHKLRAEVDAGVVVGALASLLFGAGGLGASIYRGSNGSSRGWVERIGVAVAFGAICLWDGGLLVVVVGSVERL